MDSADWLTGFRNIPDSVFEDLTHPPNCTVASGTCSPFSQANPASLSNGSDAEYYPNSVLDAGHHRLIGPLGGVPDFLISLPEQQQYWSHNLDSMEVEHAFAPTNEFSQSGLNVALDYTSLDSSEPQQYQPTSTIIEELPTQVSIPTCTFSSCNGTTFRDKACLKRHNSEVHGSQAFVCSIATCKRSKRGFHRRYNLYEHQKRVHKLQNPGTDSFGRARSASTLDDVLEEEDTPESAKLEAGSAGESSGIRRDRGFGDGKDLRMKLQNLRDLRAEIDEDIRFLERAVRIMEE